MKIFDAVASITNDINNFHDIYKLNMEVDFVLKIKINYLLVKNDYFSITF